MNMCVIIIKYLNTKSLYTHSEPLRDLHKNFTNMSQIRSVPSMKKKQLSRAWNQKNRPCFLTLSKTTMF